MYTNESALDDALRSVRRTFIRSIVGSCAVVGGAAVLYNFDLPETNLLTTVAWAKPQGGGGTGTGSSQQVRSVSPAASPAKPATQPPVVPTPKPAPQRIVVATADPEVKFEIASAPPPAAVATITSAPDSEVIPTTVYPDKLPEATPAEVKPAVKAPDVAKAPEAPKAPPPPPTPAERLGLKGKDRARAEKCLAQAVYFEARAEAVKGQIAVAQVVMNRVFSPYYPKDVCSVVYQNAHRHLSCQFTFACDGKPETIRERGAWARASRIAKQTLDAKLWLPAVAKSTHYHATYVHPAWIRDMRKMVRYGVHIFYRPRNWGDGSNEPGWGQVAEQQVAQKVAKR